MGFRNRDEAADRLAENLQDLEDQSPLVLAIPRGAVPMGRKIADRIDGDLDIVLVHKFGFPEQPEYALGSVTEEGDVILGMGAERLGLHEEDVGDAAYSEIKKLQEKRRLFTPNRPPLDPHGRVTVIIDDGIATGATMTAAVRSLHHKGARRIVVATPVASPDAVRRLQAEGAEVRSLLVPELFYSVSQFYDEFEQITDDEAIAALRAGNDDAPLETSTSSKEIAINVEGKRIKGLLMVPQGARSIVLFAHGSGSGRLSPRNQYVADRLNDAGFATLLMDLLEEEETADRRNIFDIDLLARRLISATDWLSRDPKLKDLAVGYFGASTGAAAALQAAVERSYRVEAIVSRGGRPDLARTFLNRVEAPTLLIVGGADIQVIQLNRMALAELHCQKDMNIIPGAGHLFEESGALEIVAERATQWFRDHLRPSVVKVVPRAHPSRQSPGPSANR